MVSSARLIAVTAAGLLAGALALPATASLTLYGRLNLDVEVVNGKQAGDGCPSACPNPNQYRVSSNASMFGIRGSEPLGAGVTAIFQVESQLQMDTGGGRLAGRESFVGLRGDWGTAKLGHFLSPYDDIHGIFGNAPTLTTSILSTGALWAQAYLGPPQAGGFDGRIANSVRYESPTLAGASAIVQYGTAEGSPTNGSHIASVGAFYNHGAVQLGAVYELHHAIRGTPEAPLSDTAFSVAGAYQFEGVRIGAVYERLRYDATPSTSLTRDLWGVGLTVDAGPGLVYAYWGRAGNGKGSAADGARVGGLVKGVDTGADQWELSYTWVLSARTMLYAGVVKILNQSNASYTFDVNPYPILCNPYPNGACGKPGGVVLGTIHFF